MTDSEPARLSHGRLLQVSSLIRRHRWTRTFRGTGVSGGALSEGPARHGRGRGSVVSIPVAAKFRRAAEGPAGQVSRPFFGVGGGPGWQRGKAGPGRTPPNTVVIDAQGRESGGSGFETCSGVWYPRRWPRRPCGVAINTLVDLNKLAGESLSFRRQGREWLQAYSPKFRIRGLLGSLRGAPGGALVVQSEARTFRVSISFVEQTIGIDKSGSPKF